MKHLLFVFTLLYLFTGCGGGGGGTDDPAPVSLIADAGADQTVTLGTSVQVDARGSINDPDRVYTFHWEFLDKPAGSTSVLVTESAINPFFSPDKEGEYILQLTVTDNEGHSATDTVTITVHSEEVHTRTYKMALDVNRSSVSTNIMTFLSHPAAKIVDRFYIIRDSISASVSRQGRYGTFSIDGLQLTYHKDIETNATDTGEIIVHTEGNSDIIVTVIVESLYWKQIASNNYTTIALKSNGTLWAWGQNMNTFGISHPTDSLIPVQEETHDTNWKSVSLGHSHVVALKNDGTLWAWGNNHYGALGPDAPIWGTLLPEQLGTESNWEKIAAGNSYTLAIKDDGTLWAWGANHNGQLGDGTTENKDTPIQITSSHEWQQIFTKHNSSFAIKRDGTLWAWGENRYATLGNDSINDQHTPVQITDSNNWRHISSGQSHTVGLKTNGTLWTWGDNSYGELGDGTNRYQKTPVQIGDSSWKYVSAGERHTLAIKNDGTLWAWGENRYHQSGYDNTASVNTPKRVEGDTVWHKVYASDKFSLGLDRSGRLWGWGYNDRGQLGNGTSDYILSPQKHPEITHIKQLLSKVDMTIILNEDGSIFTWGTNSSFQLGHSPDTMYVHTAQQESTHATDWKQITLGTNHVIALKENGTVWSWGANGKGQLGVGDRVDRPEARPVSTLGNDTIAVCAGHYFSAALKRDGTLWTWGALTTSMDGDTTPVQEASEGTTWHALSCGGDFILALRDGGELWSWGGNQFGQLANGTTTFTPVPQREASRSLWESISAGTNYAIGIKADSTLWGWGSNINDAIGSQDAQFRQTLPIQESTHATDWAMASAGWFQTLALKHDYTLWSWGNYAYVPSGQPNPPVAFRSDIPHQLSLETSLDTYPLWLHTDPLGSNIMIDSDHTLWSWGDNRNNQLFTPWHSPLPSPSIHRSE